MRKPTASTEAQRVEEAITTAVSHLRPLTEPAPSWSIVSWHDRSENDLRDEYYAAIGFIEALLNPDPKRDGDGRRAADNFLGEYAGIVRENIIPALWRGRPPKKQGKRPAILRDRWIAAVVATICRQYRFSPTHNPANENACGCSIVSAALGRLGKPLTEKSVTTLWIKYGQL